MEREPVESEALVSVGYDADMRVLELEFTGGAVYRYIGVPRHVHAGLMTAVSLGEYFAHHIRDAYDYEQVD